MNLIIDANIFSGFYQEHVLELPFDNTQLTSSALNLFTSKEFKVYLDESEHIETEWRNLVDREWFNAWLIGEIEAGHIINIPVENHEVVINALKTRGFPASKDKWYVRTSLSLKELENEMIFISEDIDFYDPTKKNTSKGQRLKTMTSKSSAIRKYLFKGHGVKVMPVCEFNEI